ncbi:MAG: DUF4175 domain-containing protein [Desulfobacterota bacterium]|nr:DUF4175 domain-containing protein [Thermodesulfobacteriota bacterium]
MRSGEDLERDYELLVGFLRRVSRRLRLRFVLESALLLASGAILVLLGSLFIVKAEGIFPYLPFVFILLSHLLLLFLLFLGLWRIFHGPTMVQIARRLEERAPELKDDVINSLLLYEERKEGPSPRMISEGLIRAQLRRTKERVYRMSPSQFVDLKGLLDHLRIFLPLLITLSIVLLLDRGFLNRSLLLFAHPFSTLPPKEIFLSVEPRGAVVLRGTPIEIKAKVTGDVPEKLMLLISQEGQPAASKPMEAVGKGTFSFRMASVRTSFLYQAYVDGTSSPKYRIEVVDPPEVGRVRLTLTPPDYTGLPKERVEGGHIEALKGTVVHLEAQTTKKVSEGRLILNRESEVSLQVRGDRLTGTLVILSPGTYSIKVKDPFGFENPSPIPYRVRLIPDRYPEAEILSPGQDLEVTGEEILPLLFSARDDFGITAIRLSYQLGGIERFVQLALPQNPRFIGPETYRWDLSSLSLMPGDRVIYRLEVSDNDSISGPKWGYSKTFTLKVRDERARIEREGWEMEEIASRLLDLLADQLEEARDREGLKRGVEEILDRVERQLEGVRENPQSYDLEALKRNLSSLRERILEESKEKVTQEMERLALLSEEMARRSRMRDLEALAKEVRNRQSRLLDLLQSLKERSSKEGFEAAMRELKRIEELLRSVMETLGKLASGLPDEFFNLRDLQGIDLPNLFSELEELRRRLAGGDIEGALEAAQRLLQGLSEMMASLGRMRAQAGMNAFDRFQGEMDRQSGELDRILTEQMEILSETEKLDRELRSRSESEMEERIARTRTRLREILNRLKSILPEAQGEPIEELDRLLKEGNLEGFFHLMRALEKELSENEEARRLGRESLEQAKEWNAGPKPGPSSEMRSKFSGLFPRQRGLRERTASVLEKLEALSQLFPSFDTDILRDLKAAEGSMGEAAERLFQEDASGALPPEQEAIRRLSRSQQAMRQMAQQMALRMQALRWGYPLLYDPRPGWYYGPWIPQPTLPQPEVRRPKERGFTGIDREEFEPPSKEAYRAPQLFREKVMESLKEDVPSSYRREVERYFRGLTE